MPDEQSAFVHEATLLLTEDVDPAAVGAAVTVELCGHWEHRTLFLASLSEAAVVHEAHR